MKINFRSNQIWGLGDTHCYSGTLKGIANPKVKGYDVWFAGDGGEGFSGELWRDLGALLDISARCKENDVRLFCTRGNHTNPAVWAQQDTWNLPNVFLVPDYTEAVFPNGVTALLVGGGISIDRFWRNRDGKIDYWADEITPYQKTNKKFDILFAHDAPDYFNHSTESLKTSPYAPLLIDDPKLFNDAYNQRLTMDKIVADISPKRIFSGHMHNSLSQEKGGIKYRCLDIDELLLIDAEKLK
jgi:hypothetical protein